MSCENSACSAIVLVRAKVPSTLSAILLLLLLLVLVR